MNVELAITQFKRSFWGGVVGDIYGSFFEFKTPDRIPKDISFESIKAMEYNTFGHEFGYFTDDTIFMLTFMQSIVDSDGYLPNDQLESMGRYIDKGEWTRDGVCFDVGTSTLRSYMEYMDCNYTDKSKRKGNGVLMKLAPFAFWTYLTSNDYVEDLQDFVDLTHSRNCFCTAYLMNQDLHNLFGGRDSSRWLLDIEYISRTPASNMNTHGHHIGTYYHAQDAAQSSNDFETCILNAIKKGYDTDTVACITGQLIGYDGDLSFVKYKDKIDKLLEDFVNVTIRTRNKRIG